MVEKNKDRTCSTCEHRELEDYKEPCRSCRCIHDNIFTNYAPEKRIKRYPAASEAISTLGISFPKIERVMFNGPATIIFWQDDTKTVVKCRESDTFDPEKGIAMAIAKKVLGNEDGYYEGIKKWLPKEQISEKREETSRKWCGNCRYRDVSSGSEPCFTCIFDNACKSPFTKWEPEEKPVEITCETCRYNPRSYPIGFSLACSLCSDHEYWEPKN